MPADFVRAESLMKQILRVAVEQRAEPEQKLTAVEHLKNYLEVEHSLSQRSPQHERHLENSFLLAGAINLYEFPQHNSALQKLNWLYPA